jgi:hypothetical protein
MPNDSEISICEKEPPPEYLLIESGSKKRLVKLLNSLRKYHDGWFERQGVGFNHDAAKRMIDKLLEELSDD